jgi:hypothetical protein
MQPAADIFGIKIAVTARGFTFCDRNLRINAAEANRDDAEQPGFHQQVDQTRKDAERNLAG